MMGRPRLVSGVWLGQACPCAVAVHHGAACAGSDPSKGTGRGRKRQPRLDAVAERTNSRLSSIIRDTGGAVSLAAA